MDSHQHFGLTDYLRQPQYIATFILRRGLFFYYACALYKYVIMKMMMLFQPKDRQLSRDHT